VAFWTEKTISTLRPRAVYLLAQAPTSTTADTTRTCSSEYADPVYAGCVGMSPETHAEAFAPNRLPVK